MIKSLEVTIVVDADGTAILKPPPPLAPGTHHVVLVIQSEEDSGEDDAGPPADLVMLDWSAWPSDSHFSREEIYGDDGR